MNSLDQKSVSADEIRTLFSSAMSEMYRKEVPLYGTLIELVREVNADTMAANPSLRARFEASGEIARLDVERHGAIRLGTAAELAAIRRMLAVMGMAPVGYYDLSVAGIPVHSTAFRPVSTEALNRNPFRIFCSLLRLELLDDPGLVQLAGEKLAERQIVTPRAMELIAQWESEGGLCADDAEEFVLQALETFRWHPEATVDAALYDRLLKAHRLVADVVSFKGPHINHLTPRTLDIDEVQRRMPERNICPKAVIEGPPRRKAEILLRQTSFKALEESIRFPGTDGEAKAGTHTARFGEIEQRGIALTPEGRLLYDLCLSKTREAVKVGTNGENATEYVEELNRQFRVFPDSFEELRKKRLAYFRYRPGSAQVENPQNRDIEELIALGALIAEPQTYEDFLPVSAAGIFQSNLGTDNQSNQAASSNRDGFEEALGVPVADETELYSQTEDSSLRAALDWIRKN